MTGEQDNLLKEWLGGQISLGAAANWNKDEIRIISEIAYSLAQQGRADEAIVLFEGLLAVAPATAYFQAALGAIYLRRKDLARAVHYLDAALKGEPADVISLVNRGEAYLLGGQIAEARIDLEKALRLADRSPVKSDMPNNEINLTVKRARTLLQVYKLDAENSLES